MASESKIGLLLGLAIIFVIAFVLNGLPKFGNVADTEPSNDPIIEEPSGIGNHERKHLNTSVQSESTVTQVENVSNQNINEQESTYSTLPEVKRILQESNEKPFETEAKSIRQTISELYYEVAEGDNLADIAKKFYGPTEGNKRTNVLRIFLANRKLLSSPHHIRVGQKLVIPNLASTETDGVNIGSMLSNLMFEKIDSIGMRHLTEENIVQQQIREYVVREGDNLWRVAASQLGDPTRYKEICKLNAGTLKDENTLSVGMRLYLPAQ
jgi:nucleoid-associated protein YgaU